MTQPTPQSLNAALRGAVDLSSLARPKTQPGTAGPGAPGPGGGAGPAGGPGAGAGGAPAGGAGAGGILVQGTDAEFSAIVNGTTSVPAVLILFTDQIPESANYVQTLVAEATAQEGRFRVVAVDIAANPGIVQALSPVMQEAFGQVSALPVVIGLIQGQPVPMFLGAQPVEQLRTVLEQFLSAAVANGVAGRVDGVPAQDDTTDTEEKGLPPLHQQAYDAIERGDLDGAAAAYQQALTENSSDEEARLGLGQVELMRRTQGMDPAAVRAAAADAPTDVDAQIAAADLELVGGHVEDAFLRLIDLVKVTSEEDRNRARQHLLTQFEVIGASDPRVAKARQSLMSALF